MRFLIFFQLLLLCISQVIAVNAQPNMKSPKKIKTPIKIKKLVKGKIAETRIVDFDGDKKADYIVFVSDKSKGELGTKLWIDSNLKTVKREEWINAGADFLWFINLDADSIPEIISAFGYEDGIDYSIYKQNFNGGEDTLLLAFNPIIVDRSRKNKIYWGYPWDISDVLDAPNGKSFELFCSFDHAIESDGGDNSHVPEWQKRVPVIFFAGITTQPEGTFGKVGLRKRLDLGAIVRAAGTTQ